MKNIFKRFHWPSALAGFLLALVVVGGGITWYGMTLVNSIRSGTWQNEPSWIRNIGEQVRTGALQQQATWVHGKITKIENGTLELATNGAVGPKNYIFTYDNDTLFVRLNNDEASTEIQISIEEFVVGGGVTVRTLEPIGSVSPQRAVKVLKDD
jgi:hypothetical protein